MALINGRARYLKFSISFSILPLQVEGKEIPCKLLLGLKGEIAPLLQQRITFILNDNLKFRKYMNQISYIHYPENISHKGPNPLTG